MNLFEVVVNAMNTVENIKGDKKDQAIHIINLNIDEMDVSDEQHRQMKLAVPFMIETVIWVIKNKNKIKVNTKKCLTKFCCV